MLSIAPSDMIVYHKRSLLLPHTLRDFDYYLHHPTTHTLTPVPQHINLTSHKDRLKITKTTKMLSVEEFISCLHISWLLVQFFLVLFVLISAFLTLLVVTGYTFCIMLGSCAYFRATTEENAQKQAGKWTWMKGKGVEKAEE